MQKYQPLGWLPVTYVQHTIAVPSTGYRRRSVNCLFISERGYTRQFAAFQEL